MKINSLYRHFKGGIYKVICIAKDCETLENTVVYQSMETNLYWTRLEKVFLSRLGDEHAEKYRFTEIN